MSILCQICFYFCCPIIFLASSIPSSAVMAGITVSSKTSSQSAIAAIIGAMLSTSAMQMRARSSVWSQCSATIFSPYGYFHCSRRAVLFLLVPPSGLPKVTNNIIFTFFISSFSLQPFPGTNLGAFSVHSSSLPLASMACKCIPMAQAIQAGRIATKAAIDKSNQGTAPKTRLIFSAAAITPNTENMIPLS